MAIITGTSGADTLTGTTGNDELYGLAGNDTLNGGNGNDLLDGGAGADILNGGAGIDTATYANSGSAVNVSLLTGVGSGGDAEGDKLIDIETVIGSNYNDVLTGGSGTVTHTLQGGLGNDTYIINNATYNKVVEDVGGGVDEVRTSLATLSMEKWANVENLTYTGTTAFTGTGNASDNVITGGAGNDTLIGGAGADRLVGGAGTDTASYSTAASGVTVNLKTGVHTGDAAGDTFDSIEGFLGSRYADTFMSNANAGYTFNGGAGIDIVDYSGSSQAVTVNLATGVGSGGDAAGDKLIDIETVIGSNYNDVLTGGSGTVTHTLQGGLGNDTYIINNATYNKVVEDVGGGVDEVRTSLATLSMEKWANVENLTYTGTTAFTGTGNASDNVITGGAGNDTLDGGAGNDTLIGGAGNDTLIGGAGADRLVGGAGTDTASYSTAASGGVTINLKTGEHTGDAAGDTFESIEGFLGSRFADTFVSSANAGYTFNGGVGIDVIDYSTSSGAVNVNLLTGVGSGGDAEGDKLIDIETVIGSNYNDVLTGGTGTVIHTLQGGLGNDTYVISNATYNKVVEDADGGIDEVKTSLATLSMEKWANVENLTYTGTVAFTGTGNASDNVITGGAGNDVLIGGAGADRLVGGAGTDTASYSTAAKGVTLNLKTGVHTGDAAGDTFDSIESFLGSNYADTFISGAYAGHYFNGGTGIDVIDYSTSSQAVNVNLKTGVGSGGDAAGDTYANIETVIGSDHDDVLTGNGSSSAVHTLQGGLGNDTYVINTAEAYNKVVEAADGGGDEVQTSLAALSIANWANVENLTYTGTAAFTGTGNVGNNVITGGAGNDTLIGGAGADRLVGGAGTDTASYATARGGVMVNLKTGVHTGDAAGDTFDSIEIFQGSNYADTFISSANAGYYFNGGTGNDTIDYSGSSQAVTVNLATGVGSGGDAAGDTYTNIETVIGSDHDDVLTGNGSSSAVHTLQGGLGNDTYIINNATYNKVVEDVGGGIDEVKTSLATLSMANWANVEKLTYTGTGNFTGIGNDGDNVITGGAGNDTFMGGAGADHFTGGAGIDTVSYADSSTRMTFNMITGEFSGIGAGDTFDSIEWIIGTNCGSTVIASAGADYIKGGDGMDMISYEEATSAVTINLATGIHTGFAAGDFPEYFEIIQGSKYDDTLIGDGGNSIFIGGVGADTINGGAGDDSVWYVTSSSGVQVDLQTGLGFGGDATGDILSNINNLIGSNYDDILIGDDRANRLEGGDGNDVIYGGAGNDIITGGFYNGLGDPLSAEISHIEQADLLYGGDGNDKIYTGPYDRNSKAYGEAGNDEITVYNAEAYGGDGSDILIGFGNDYKLYGEAGEDILRLYGDGFADGGEGGDVYRILDSVGITTIHDSGISGTDYLYLDKIANQSDLFLGRAGDDLFITSMQDMADGYMDSGAIMKDWYNGGNTIEQFVLANGTQFQISA